MKVCQRQNKRKPFDSSKQRNSDLPRDFVKKPTKTQSELTAVWAMTIHKCQGLTLSKAWIDLGSSERSPGITYVALSRVKKIQDLLIEPMTLERLQAVKKSTNFKFRLEEENRLDMLANETLNSHLKIS